MCQPKRLTRILSAVVVLALLLNSGLAVPAIAEGEVTVSINAPAEVTPGGNFTATVNITQVVNFDAANFDVSFNPAVLRLDNVTSGNIGGVTVPVAGWNWREPGRYSILVNIPGVASATGSGYLAVLHFSVLGSPGQSSSINLSDGMLSNTLAEGIPAIWVGDSVTIPLVVQLVSIAVTPANPSISLGQTQQFNATGTYTDNSTDNLTTAVTWTSANTSVASINATGLATALAAGNTTITATSGNISGNTTLTVSAIIPPTVTTDNATNITTSSATLKGSLSSLGTASNTTVSFEWGTTSGNLTQQTTPQVIYSLGPFSANLSSLSANTTYYFRAKAVGDGISYGAERSFTTLALILPPPFLLKWGIYGSGDGQFQYPTGVAVDASGNVYVTDQDNHRIQKFTSAGAFITKWGIYGSGDGQFQYPMGVAVDASGNVYAAEYTNHRIQKFTSSGDFITKWGTYGTGNGQFNVPIGVAVDGSGNVYVADSTNYRIQKFTSAGTFITKWGIYGSGDAQFQYPTGVAVDASGNVYVADQDNNRIQKFTSAGAFITKWGIYGSGDGQFQYPRGVAVDASGNVYVADQNNNRIQKFTSSGDFITKWGIYGSGNGQFSYPIGVAVDASDNVFVADTQNNRIQVFGVALPPTVTTSNADNITVTSARLKGTLTGLGTASSVNVSFQWGLTSGNYTSTTSPVSMNVPGAFSANLTGLSANTTYYFRAKADGDGISYGFEKSFTTLAVTAPELVSIAVTPLNPSIDMGLTQQFTATGTYSDNSTADLTATANWTSSNTTVATINAAGLATAVAAGSTTITATYGAISGNTTLTVTIATTVEVNNGNTITLNVGANITGSTTGGIPIDVKGIVVSENAEGLAAFDFTLNWNPAVIRVDRVRGAATATDDFGWSFTIGAINNTIGTVTFVGTTTQQPYSSADLTLAYLGLGAVGQMGDNTTLTVTITNLTDNIFNEITPRVAVNAPVVIGINLVAETSIAQGLSSNVTVAKVNINRIKNLSDNATVTIPGGIGSYTATVSSNVSNAIQFLAVNGVSPFDSPSFNATSGVFSVPVVASPIQANNTTVAEVVPILTGNTTTRLTLTITFQIISAADQPGLNVPEENAKTIILLRGDADKNGAISIVDSLAIKQYLVGQLTLAQINPINAASPKHDGAGGDKISIVDALAVEQFLVGQIGAYYQ